MTKILGIPYGRAATANITNFGPALAPTTLKEMFPNETWIMITPDAFNLAECQSDRFGENLKIQQKIYNSTPNTPHIMIGGDHSINFGHFAAIADKFQSEEICLVYIDAHLDIHTPESSMTEASGAPHGTNVRALLGDGDRRWLELQTKKPALKPENLFYIASRSFEPSEINFAKSKNIFIRTPSDIDTQTKLQATIDEIRAKIGTKKFVVSFDFDAIDPKYFHDVLVPEPNGISVESAKHLIRAFSDAYSFEFVEYAPNGDKGSAQIAHDLIITLLNK